MKIKTVIFFILLVLLSSCAEEGPITMGKFECEIDVPIITQNSAVIKVVIPRRDNNILYPDDRVHVYLLDNPLKPSEDFPVYAYDYWFRVSSTETYYDELDKKYYFWGVADNLTPNKTYYVCIEALMHLNGKGDYNDGRYYYTGYSFTTSSIQEIDNPDLDNATCESLGMPNEYGYMNVRFYLPENIGGVNIEKIFASKSEDMSQPINLFHSNSSVNGYFPTQVFDLPIYTRYLENTKYYLQIEGDIYYKISENHYIVLRGVTLNVSNPLDLSEEKAETQY